MASKYDSIKTAEDLVREVMIHGMSTAQEDICRAQDIFGHSAVEELVKLATDNGRNDANGKPDPKGSWSSGRRGTYSTFYMILFNIWNWEDATRFWNQHNNPEHEKLADLTVEKKAADAKIARLEEEQKKTGDLYTHACKAIEDERKSYNEVEKKLRDAEAEIIRLKAKLFDMMEGTK